jgi:thiol-disulfide isomerase/thioredoxin
MQEIGTYQELQRFIEINKNVVVFIGSLKCGHCRNIHPEIVKLTPKYNHIKFVHIEVSKFDRMEKLNISQGVPVFDFYKNGIYNSRVEGADLDAIINKINSLYRNDQLQNQPMNKYQSQQNMNYAYSQPSNQMNNSQYSQYSQYSQPSNQMNNSQPSNQMNNSQPSNQMNNSQYSKYSQPSNNYYYTPQTPLTNSQISMGYTNQQNRNVPNNTFERFNTSQFNNNRK